MAYRAGERWVFRGGYGITQYMEGTGANLRLPLNPPFFFESQSTYNATSGPEHDRDRIRRPAGARSAVGRRPRLGSEPAAAVHPAVEPVRGVPDRLAVVDQRRLRRQQVEYLVTPIEGNQPLPGVGNPSTWAPLNRAGRCSRSTRRSPTSARPPRAAAPTTTRCRPPSSSGCGTDSTSSPTTR